MTISVVCVHGLGGRPATLAPVVEGLLSAGHRVTAPLLPGHGSRPESLRHVTWDDWAAAARTAVDRAAGPGGTVVVVGQSLGGTLALALAIDSPAIVGVATINAPVVPADPEALAHLPPDDELVDVGPPDVRDPDVVEDAYTELPAGALRELHRGAAWVHDRLGEVRVPVLVASSAHDGVVDPWDADVLTRGVAGPVERLVLPRSGHVATLDVDRDLLVATIVAFVGDITRT